MALYVIKHSPGPNDLTILPGHWRLSKGKVWVACPKCGLVGQLDHAVHYDGMVIPSLVCPAEDCVFHEHVLLDGFQ